LRIRRTRVNKLRVRILKVFWGGDTVEGLMVRGVWIEGMRFKSSKGGGRG
jgi:hypothetical protein